MARLKGASIRPPPPIQPRTRAAHARALCHVLVRMAHVRCRLSWAELGWVVWAGLGWVGLG